MGFQSLYSQDKAGLNSPTCKITRNGNMFFDEVIMPDYDIYFMMLFDHTDYNDVHTGSEVSRFPDESLVHFFVDPTKDGALQYFAWSMREN
jgi:hypothetical protein